MAPHRFLFFQVLPHLFINGTTITHSITQARNLGIILSPPFPLLLAEEGNTVVRGVAHYYFPVHTLLCARYILFIFFHDHFIFFLIFKYCLKNVKQVCGSLTFKDKPTISRFQHNLYFF